jgi:hypothetical protein
MQIGDQIVQGKDTFTLIIINPNGNVYSKHNRSLYGKCFFYQECQFCGKIISNAGWAQKPHYDMHVRNGDIK